MGVQQVSVLCSLLEFMGLLKEMSIHYPYAEMFNYCSHTEYIAKCRGEGGDNGGGGGGSGGEV